MAPKALPSPEALRQLLRYEPETGKLFWRERPAKMFKDAGDAKRWNTRLAGQETFITVDGKGYLQGSIWGVLYRAHRVIWAMETGAWPSGQIDHQNGLRVDNRFKNLREVTNAENGRNCPKSRANTSGTTGITWDKSRGKWKDQIKVDGRNHNLGHFMELSEACAARKAAEAGFGFHENHGRERRAG